MIHSQQLGWGLPGLGKASHLTATATVASLKLGSQPNGVIDLNIQSTALAPPAMPISQEAWLPFAMSHQIVKTRPCGWKAFQSLQPRTVAMENREGVGRPPLPWCHAIHCAPPASLSAWLRRSPTHAAPVPDMPPGLCLLGFALLGAGEVGDPRQSPSLCF